MSRMKPMKRGGSTPLHLAHGEVARELAAVLALRPHLAADADDVRVARAHVALEVAVVLAVIRLGHQHR
jgi:hypothetical protein